MSRKRKSRSKRLAHVVARFDGSPMTQLDPDCPICAMLAREGQEVLTLDPETMELVPVAPRPARPH
jgi:hypothetical protein